MPIDIEEDGSFIISLGGEKDKFYNDLLKKYEGYKFDTREKEDNFLNDIKTLISENEEVVEFEVKVQLLNMLTASIEYQKFRIG
jgi:hypothetical protein